MKNKYEIRGEVTAIFLNRNNIRVPIKLHRWITNCPENMEVDHYNNDTLDNRRLINLRVSSHAENLQNRLKACINSKSGIRGVWWEERKQKWQAQIKLNGKNKHLGYFSTIEDAEIAVKAARRIYMPFSKEAVSL